MKRFSAGFAALLRDDRGVTAIEYALIAGFMAVGLVVALPSITAALQAVFPAIAAYFP